MSTTDGAPLTGLFLGAGASYELAMPLVWGLTNELTAWLTPQKLRTLNEGWRSQGGGFPDTVIDDLARVLVRDDMHYEAILGYLETQYRRPESNGSQAQHYYGLYSWLVEMVYHLFYFRHVTNEGFITVGLRYFEGIVGLAARNSPLWVFSLNHDLMIECLAAHYGIALNSGFTGSITLPRRDKSGAKIGELEARVITEEDLEKSGPAFWQSTGGINLLKIHGSLDIFAFRDGRDLLKLRPTGPGVHGVMESLRAANEELLYTQPEWPRPAKATNEIAYADEQGEMQFLRRSLLAGANKFNARHNQVLPRRFIEYFRGNINYVSTLVCIGYGFGDIHINTVMREWLELSAQRRLVIVSTNAAMPPSLLHLAPQVEVIRRKATEYLQEYASNPLTDEERHLKWLRDGEIAWIDQEKATAALGASVA